MQKFVLRTALRPSQIGFSHGLGHSFRSLGGQAVTAENQSRQQPCRMRSALQATSAFARCNVGMIELLPQRATT
jgi:hypothetical protein